MKVVVIGGSLFALELAKELYNSENKVIYVIENKDEARKISNEHNFVVVNGSPLDPEILDELELSDAEVFVAATDYEEINILSALYAKYANVKRIFVKTNNANTENILKKLNIQPINPEVYAAKTIELKITRSAVADLVGAGVGEFDMVERNAKEFPNLIGKTIKQVEDYFFTTIAVYKDRNYYFVADTPIDEDSILIILCTTDKEKKLDKSLHGIKSEKKSKEESE